MIERIFAAPMARLREWLQGLAPRERALVLLAAGTTLLLVVWLGLIAPLRESLATLERHIALARRDVGLTASLAERHRTLSRDIDRLEHGTSPEDRATSLFARLEALTVPIVGREHVSAMNPASRAVGEQLEEETVDMRLEGIPMQDLIELLYAIEYRDPPLRVTRLSFKRQYKEPTLLDATLVVGRLRPR